MSTLMINTLIRNRYLFKAQHWGKEGLKLMRVPVLKQIILYYGSKDRYINKQGRNIRMWILDHQFGEIKGGFKGMCLQTIQG